MAQHDLPGAPPRCLSNIQPWHAQMHYGQQPYFEHPAVNSPSASCRAHSISSTSVRLPTSTLILKAVAPSKFVSVLSITMSLHGGRKRRLYMGFTEAFAISDVPGLVYSPETFGLCYCNHNKVGVSAQQDISVDILYFNRQLLRSKRERASLTRDLRHLTREPVYR